VSRLERAAAGTLTVVLLALLTIEPAPPAVGVAVRPSLPSYKGLNYGVPLTQDGDWVGTAWLRPSAWPAVRPAIAADLVFIEQHHLGRVVRLFIALDQLMDWDRSLGFRGFRAAELAHLDETLDLFDAHGIRAVAVLYDQEVISSPGNFRFAALDGRHAAMRDGYLRATEGFLARYRQRATVAAWDLFNEAYASLGTGGGRPRPPAPDPVSPGYQTSTVHSFLHDLYLAARRAAPDAPLTVSDATLYFQPQPDLSLYDDILDFYDVHVYDDHPRLEALSRSSSARPGRRWRATPSPTSGSSRAWSSPSWSKDGEPEPSPCWSTRSPARTSSPPRATGSPLPARCWRPSTRHRRPGPNGPLC